MTKFEKLNEAILNLGKKKLAGKRNERFKKK